MERFLKLGATRVPFPLPQGSLQENIANLRGNFPLLRFTEVLESDAVAVSATEIEYPVVLPTKHKG